MRTLVWDAVAVDSTSSNSLLSHLTIMYVACMPFICCRRRD